MSDLLESIGRGLLWIGRHYGDPASPEYLYGKPLPGEEVTNP